MGVEFGQASEQLSVYLTLLSMNIFQTPIKSLSISNFLMHLVNYFDLADANDFFEFQDKSPDNHFGLCVHRLKLQKNQQYLQKIC